MESPKYYTDINLNMEPHPLTGDVTVLVNEMAVRRSLVHVGQMLPFDIPFEPDLHGYVRELLFELPSDTTRLALASRVKWAIQRIEPRADVLDVRVTLSHDETSYYVEVAFRVKSLLNEYTIGFYLERIR